MTRQRSAFDEIDADYQRGIKRARKAYEDEMRPHRKMFSEITRECRRKEQAELQILARTRAERLRKARGAVTQPEDAASMAVTNLHGTSTISLSRLRCLEAEQRA